MTAGAFWQEEVVYQIYPRSFMDSNGDGIGDLRGIISKLDYLKELGVGIVWLSPVYKSPNDDNGYDISDYRSIMDEFGTMEDWEELLHGLHERGIKLIMDLVVNHSSDEHAWFEESRKSKDNPYRDYYIWRPAGENGGEPNNWLSFFGGSAWQYDEATNEYYLHLFTKKQPDLNWENPKLRREVYDMMNFWLDKGIDGFRMDVINCISKADGLPSAPGGERYAWGGDFFLCGPRLEEYLKEMNEQTLSRYNAMSVGEMPGVPTDLAAVYTDPANRAVNMVFHFETMDIDSGEGGKWNLKPWKLADLKAVTGKWQYALNGKGWNSLYLNNHDQPRMVSRFGDDTVYRKQSAKLLATFLHTLQGTPYIYQGEELGMTNVRFESIDDYRDVELLNFYREAVGERGVPHEQAMASIYAKGRDNARTPMQWNAGPQGGFTTGEPWIGVNPNYTEINAQEALGDPDSIFHYYKRLIALRKKHPIMIYGDYTLLAEEHEQLYAYTRQLGEEKWLVLLNFSGQQIEAGAGLPFEEGAELIISNYGDAAARLDASAELLALRPYEALVYRLA
ncbi:alpha-glucosidase [Paenibacillus sp. N4]|uniref:glycoside hydrolase family 13 protein n=1 Tax=Paenibacillus vietnamensis TaxID=2590547 RepID=UPI001CD06709|nr:alpha-glucosidase [Paenibacillus vietnamensis]MCA0758495.1 alpha-glucosidase [Paenibacillus vietnamensis]